MKKMQVVKVCSLNNEIHFVIQECENEGGPSSVFSSAKVKEIMKKEAAKPLLLLRAE